MQYGSIAQAIGILTPAFASGYGMCFSHAGATSIKTILGRNKAADRTASSYAIRHSLTQFSALYETGKGTAPWLGLFASCHLAYLAYISGDWRRTYYNIAAIFPLAIVPFTLFLKPTNDALFRLKDKAYKDDDSLTGVQGELAVSRLLDKWIKINYVRQMLPLVASFIAVWVFLQ